MACDCTTTPSVTTTPAPGNGCLQVRYICQLIGGVSTWVLDVVNTECIDNSLCPEYAESCDGLEYVYQHQSACVLGDPLPTLPTPSCAANCGPTTTTTTTSTTSTTSTTTSSTTTSSTTTTAPGGISVGDWFWNPIAGAWQETGGTNACGLTCTPSCTPNSTATTCGNPCPVVGGPGMGTGGYPAPPC